MANPETGMAIEAGAGYRAVLESAGVAERGDIALLRLWGRDPVKMLHGLITNDLAAAPAGQGVYAAMLTPKGRMIAELRAFPRRGAQPAEVLVAVPRQALEGTREHFRKFIPPMFSRWADVSGEAGAVGIYGPAAQTILAAVLREDPPELAEDGYWEPTFGETSLLVARTLDIGGMNGYDLFAPAPALEALRGALLAAGASPVEPEALEVLRIEAGRPRYGSELTEETIPTEAYESTGLMPRAISFGKGCYTGQEVIVRIAHRGHVNRHLRGLLLGDLPLPEARTPLFHRESGKEIGWTTSAARSPRAGEGVALGYLRREVGPGDRVRLGGVDGPEVAVAPLPFVASSSG